jgi:hypothetical protein
VTKASLVGAVVVCATLLNLFEPFEPLERF